MAHVERNGKCFLKKKKEKKPSRIVAPNQTLIFVFDVRSVQWVPMCSSDNEHKSNKQSKNEQTISIRWGPFVGITTYLWMAVQSQSRSLYILPIKLFKPQKNI